jgi:hypothetical protein
MTTETKVRTLESVQMMPGWIGCSTIQSPSWYYIDSMWAKEANSSFEILSIKLRYNEISQIPRDVFPFTANVLEINFLQGVSERGLLVVPPGCNLSFDYKNTGSAEGRLTITTSGSESDSDPHVFFST